MIINENNMQHKYRILHIFEFDSARYHIYHINCYSYISSSERKRMSIVVKDSNNQLLIYTKGADSIIMSRLDSKLKLNKNFFLLEMKKKIEKI